MTDRELLELAAKAAGMPPPYDANGVFSAWIGGTYSGHWWSPLTDDGDALRLAVRLGMFSTSQGLSEFQAFYSDEISRDNKPTVATRRAIVTIAAYIGKAMP